MARIIAISNQKGGVGKTTSAVNLAAYLSALGRKVLVVDFDPQANATSGLGISPKLVDKSIYHALFGYATHDQIIKPTDLFNYHIAPSSPDLAGALVELVHLPEREFILRKFLNRIRHHYQYIIIDLPPSLNLLTVNGLAAADEVIIPVQAEYYSLEGLSQLLDTIDLINKNLNVKIEIAGAVITMHNRRETLCRQVSKEMRRHFPHHVYMTEIPRSVALAEAPSFSKPIILYSPNSPGARAYEAFAREVIAQEQQHDAALLSRSQFGDFTV